MEARMSAIDLLTLQTIAKREKSHFDAIVSGVKSARVGGGSRGYGYNENMRTHLNESVDIAAAKQAADAIEGDMRAIKSAIVKHNSTTKVTYRDAIAGIDREASIFEAFNVLKDAEADMSKMHGEVVGNISVTLHKDVALEPEKVFEDTSAAESDYHELMATVFSLKSGIAKANNKTVKVEILSDQLAAILS